MATLIPEDAVQKSTISLEPQRQDPVTDPNTISEEVEKTDYALGAQSPGPDSINAYIASNNSQTLRTQTLMQQQIADRRVRQQYVAEAARRAAAEGRNLEVEDYQVLQEVSRQELTANEDTIFERLYANRIAREALEESAPDDVPEIPEVAEQAKFTAEDYVAKQEIAKRFISGLNTIYAQNGLMSNVWDFGRQFVPFYSAMSQTGDQSGVDQSAGGGRFFNPGGTKAAEYQALFFLPPEEFEAAVKAKIDDIRQNSTLEALVWAQGLLDYTATSAALDTAFNAIDIVSVGAPVLGKLAKSARGLAKANKIPLNKTSRLVVTGNTQAAARSQAFTRLQSKVSPTPKFGVQTGTPKPVVQKLDLMQQGQGLLDPQVPLRNPGSLSNEAAARLLDGVAQDSRILISALDDVTNVTRINEAAFVEGVYKAEQRFNKQYTKLEDAVLEITPVRESEDVFGGVDHIQVVLGDKNALPFKTQASAENWATNMYRLPKGEYEVAQGAGNNWFITIRKNIDETERTVQDLRIATDNRNPETLLNSFIGYLRSPDDLLSAPHTAARKQAVYGSNAVLNKVKAVAASIGRLPKQELSDLTQILDHARFEWRAVITPSGPGRAMGKFYETVSDLEGAYLSRFKRLPSEQEARAYYAFKGISDLDYIQRNVSIARDKARLGIEQISFGASVQNANGLWTYKNLDFMEGKIIESLPPNASGTYGVAYIDPKTGRIKAGLSDRITPGFSYKDMDAAIKSGDYKIIQLFDPNNEILRSLNVGKGEPINYLVVKDIKTKPVSSQQIPYTEGGSWAYSHNNLYVKQAVTHKSAFGRRVYTGDKTAFGFQVPALARKLGQAMEEGRKMLVSGAPKAQVTAFVQKNLPYADADEFARQFRMPNGTGDEPFDLNSPFLVTEAGQSVSDVRRLDDIFGEAVVGMDNAHSLTSKVGSDYAQTDPLKTVKNLGTEANPVFKLDQAQMLDPMESLLRTSSRVSSDALFEDYKHMAVENWAKQFSAALDVSPYELNANPMRYLLEPKWNTAANNAHLGAAKNARRAILQFMGQDTPDSRAWKAMRQGLVDTIYKTWGQDKAQILEPHLWSNATEPVTLARSAVFHAKLGFFNPVQFFTQASGTLHAMAIDGNPRRAAQATFAYWAMRMGQMAPAGGKWSKVTDKIGKALNLDPGILDDMYIQYTKSGMNVVEGEYGILDDYLNPKLFQGKTGKALDAGTVFFKEGNNVHRGTSFALSYLKWREANPLAKVTAQDLQQIVDRADLMYVNMSRASNSALQNPNSVMSVPMQFFGYHARMTEQMLGKRLTWPEKIRLMTAYGVMYGVPVGVGGTALGVFWPVRESTRQYALEHGLNVDGDIATKVLVDGVGSLLMQWMTGENYDVASRFGPGGMSLFKDLLDAGSGRGSLLDIMGAGPNFLVEGLATMKPFVAATMSAFDGNPDTAYGLKAEDFIDVLKNVSTFNNFTKAYAVYNTGQWLTKSQGVVGYVKDDFPNAVAVALGLTPQVVQDAYLMLDSNTAETEAKAAISREALVQFRRGLKAANDGDPKGMQDWFNRARWLMISGGFDPLESTQVFKRAIRENESMINSIGEDFMLNDPEIRQEHYKKTFMEQLDNGTQ